MSSCCFGALLQFACALFICGRDKAADRNSLLSHVQLLHTLHKACKVKEVIEVASSDSESESESDAHVGGSDKQDASDHQHSHGGHSAAAEAGMSADIDDELSRESDM